MTIPEASLPFAVASVLAAANALCAWAVQRRAEEFTRAKDGAFAKFEPPPHLTPEGIGTMAGWAADAASSGVIAVSPIVAGLLLVDDPPAELIAVYACACLGGLAVFLWTLFASPVRYVGRQWKGLTIVSGIGILLNLALALIVGLLA